ncbi:MAG: Omp28 family outer membrane lipoprotein [Chlorobi bacterium]|nr:Omp28 family outer membrane lipoprotein [Chlorobiota bacterium]
MKKITTLLFLIIGSLFFFAACEIIDPPYKIEKPDHGDTIPDTILVKRVLVEDYTGHNCPNCPAAAEKAEDLKDFYGPQIIVMAVHAGYFAKPVPDDPLFSNDFRTPAGNAWNSFFNITSYPSGMINRIPDDQGNYIISPGNWGLTVDAELKKDAEAKITVQNDFSSGTRLLRTTVTTEFLAPQDVAFNLVVCITQDSIIGGQIFTTHVEENYVFMNVLRGTLNGDWGEDVSGGLDIVADEKYEKTYSIVFPAEWVAKHCHVVAFIYNTDTYSILQVEEKGVIK